MDTANTIDEILLEIIFPEQTQPIEHKNPGVMITCQICNESVILFHVNPTGKHYIKRATQKWQYDDERYKINFRYELDMDALWELEF